MDNSSFNISFFGIINEEITLMAANIGVTKTTINYSKTKFILEMFIKYIFIFLGNKVRLLFFALK